MESGHEIDSPATVDQATGAHSAFVTNVTGTAPRTRGASPLPVYLTSAVLARTADDGARVALVMLATQRADSPALGGALVAALMIPHVAAAPVVGVLADSVRRRRLFHGSAVALYGAALAARSRP